MSTLQHGGNDTESTRLSGRVSAQSRDTIGVQCVGIGAYPYGLHVSVVNHCESPIPVPNDRPGDPACLRCFSSFWARFTTLSTTSDGFSRSAA